MRWDIYSPHWPDDVIWILQAHLLHEYFFFNDWTFPVVCQKYLGNFVFTMAISFKRNCHCKKVKKFQQSGFLRMFQRYKTFSVPKYSHLPTLRENLAMFGLSSMPNWFSQLAFKISSNNIANGPSIHIKHNAASVCLCECVNSNTT